MEVRDATGCDFVRTAPQRGTGVAAGAFGATDVVSPPACTAFNSISATLMLFPRHQGGIDVVDPGPGRVTLGSVGPVGRLGPGGLPQPPSLTSLAAGEPTILLVGLKMRHA